MFKNLSMLDMDLAIVLVSIKLMILKNERRNLIYVTLPKEITCYCQFKC